MLKAGGRWTLTVVGRGFAAALLLTLSWVSTRAEPTPARAPATLLQMACGTCHESKAPGQYARISSMRKTPEGWLMTIVRMQHLYGVQLTDADRDALVRHLADTQGLAPAEAAPARFALERRPNVRDLVLPHGLQDLCARCHTAARVALQRRSADDWLKNVHFHLAQWPTIEYQDKARDRGWWPIASTAVPEVLGRLFPLDSPAWNEWRSRPAADLSGEWRIRGHELGRGSYWGTARIERTAKGEYTAVYQLEDGRGERHDGESTAIVYTGYEWRGSGLLGTRRTREVFALSEDGQSLSGRWFDPDHTEVGTEWVATRAGSTPRIVAVSPAAIRIGARARVAIFGDALHGRVSFGPGVKWRVLSRTPTSIVAEVTAQDGATNGHVAVRVGSASAVDQFAVYDRVDRLVVAPQLGIARVGGGKVDPVTAQFEATAYLDLQGPDGGTTAVRLGDLPVSWAVEPYNDEAREAQDVKYAGRIDDTGRFLPAGGGPNLERKYSANNVGDLAVTATLADANLPAVVGRAHLIVTVQRWNSPPIL